jgi:hypothetical protein
MKYLLLMYHSEGVFSDGELRDGMAQAVSTCHQLHAKGQYVDASPLRPVATATSVAVRDGRTVATDGPFAETKEQLGGYVLVDVNSLGEAIAIAERFPAANKGTVEIRPLVER